MEDCGVKPAEVRKSTGFPSSVRAERRVFQGPCGSWEEFSGFVVYQTHLNPSGRAAALGSVALVSVTAPGFPFLSTQRLGSLAGKLFCSWLGLAAGFSPAVSV